MKKITSSELKLKTRKCLDYARKGPVEIDKNGKPVAVLIAYEDYDRLTKLDNKYWLARVEAAKKHGFAGAKATSNFFKQILSRQEFDRKR